MSELLELRHKLQDTASTITQLERSLALEPDSLGLRLTLESVVKRFDELQVDFQDLRQHLLFLRRLKMRK